MMTYVKPVHLDPNDVPENLRTAHGYTGRKFKACPTETVNISSQQWSGGSRDTYLIVHLASGRSQPMTDPRPWPESMAPLAEVEIPEGCAIVEHSIFCGKDLGLTFHMRPENVTAWLPAPTDFTPLERLILAATSGYKSSYNGQDRYQMACNDIQHGYSVANTRVPEQPVPTREQWDMAKAGLIERKYLNKAGAITPKGRNAA